MEAHICGRERAANGGGAVAGAGASWFAGEARPPERLDRRSREWGDGYLMEAMDCIVGMRVLW